MKKNIFLPLVIFSFCTNAFAVEDHVKVSFDEIKPHRENFKDKFIQIEGRVKNLKVIKEGGSKFATFFLSEGNNPENTISVKVNLSKRKDVINTFDCKDGQFTTVEGRFKAWGTASYLGKIDIKDSYDFKCSEIAQVVHKAAPVEVAKKAATPKKEIVEDTPKPIILKTGGGVNQVVDASGKAVTGSGSILEPGSVIKTGANSFVQLKYPDGSKLSIGANSQLTTETGTKAVQSVALKFGKVHALIHKEATQDLHFKIKTRTATMGVRGTQFFVDESKDGKVSTHVIDGRVDVAKSDAILSSGKGRHVLRGEFVDVDNGKVSEPKHFEAAEYLAKMKSEQAELVAFADNASDAEEAVTPAAAAPAPVKNASTENNSEKPEWAVFRLAPLVYLTKDTSATFTGMISWNPETHLIGNWKLGVDLGYSMIKRVTSVSLFEYAVVGSFAFNSTLSAEIKAGAQSWLSPVSATGGMGGLALKYSLCDRCPINHIILGDDVLSISGSTLNIVRVGVGFEF